MTRIIGISGSLRRGSFNTALLREAAGLTPPEATLEIESILEIPLYNFDIEATAGIPEPVARLKETIAASDALLIATPEYNNSIPGVVKNAIDWLSRPPEDIPRIFGNRPVAVMGASPGQFGTVLSQNAWLPVLRTLRAQFWTSGRLLVPRAGKVFNDAGNLVDEQIRERLRAFVHDFVAFVQRKA